MEPQVAREVYLNSVEPSEQARIIRHAEKLGPLPTDADWLVAHAASQAVARIEALLLSFEARMDEILKKASRDSGISVVRRQDPARPLWTFACSLSTFAGVAYVVERFRLQHDQALVLYSLAIALGVAGSALYIAITRYFARR